MEEAIEILTKLLIKEHLEKKETYYKFKKEDLYKFCIKLLKIIEANK